MENYYIKENSIGKAWKESIKLINEKGQVIHDGEDKLYEILGLHIRIENPNENDSLEIYL